MNRWFLVLMFLGLVGLVGCVEQLAVDGSGTIADETDYLSGVKEELVKEWPSNRTINIVFYGHSVVAGYFATPVVDTFNSYPYLLHRSLKEKYPYAVINVITSAIGSENSVSGAARFSSAALGHKPDVLLIDYALNDREAGLADAYKAWSSMIVAAKRANVKIILLTPTIDLNHVAGDVEEPLNQHAVQIRSLAAKYNIGLVDSLAAFDDELKGGVNNVELLSNGWNHPNRRGHEIVASQILKWFR